MNKDSNTIVVTRHKNLVKYLEETNVISSRVNVIEHATEGCVKGKNVIGVLPYRLACLASSITEVSMDIPKEMRGKDLSVKDMKGFNLRMKKYKVVEI